MPDMAAKSYSLFLGFESSELVFERFENDQFQVGREGTPRQFGFFEPGRSEQASLHKLHRAAKDHCHVPLN